MNAVVSSISQLLPAEILDTDPERIALYSQDVFTIGPPIGAIVRPRCIEEVQSLVAACRERQNKDHLNLYCIQIGKSRLERLLRFERQL